MSWTAFGRLAPLSGWTQNAEGAEALSASSRSQSASDYLRAILAQFENPAFVVIDPQTGKVYATDNADDKDALLAAIDPSTTLELTPESGQSGLGLAWNWSDIGSFQNASVIAAATVDARKPKLSAWSLCQRLLVQEVGQPIVAVLDQVSGKVQLFYPTDPAAASAALAGLTPASANAIGLQITRADLDIDLPFEGGFIGGAGPWQTELIAMWVFDGLEPEDTEIPDLAGNYPLTWATERVTVESLFGSALQVTVNDGGRAYTADNPTDFDIGDDFLTLAAVIRVPTGTTGAKIMVKGSENQGWSFNVSSERIGFTVWFEGNISEAIDTENDFTLDEWHLVIAGYDSDLKKAWVKLDGHDAIYGGEGEGNPIGTTDPIQIGSLDGEVVGDIAIDQAAAWGRSLSGAEMAFLWSGGAMVAFGDLV